MKEAFSEKSSGKNEEEINFELPLNFFAQEMMQSIIELRKQIRILQEQMFRAFVEIEKLKELKKAMEDTNDCDAMTVNLALNYSARNEIIDAAKKFASQVKSGKVEANDLDEGSFAGLLYTAGQPDPDLLIRTSGEMRISNFLLWQIAYSEICEVEKLWPDFKKEDFKK